MGVCAEGEEKHFEDEEVKSVGGPFTHKAKSLRVMAAVRAGNGVVGEDYCEPSAQVLGKGRGTR